MSSFNLGRGFLGFVAVLLVSPAIAQQESAMLEEIVITATKRATTLQEAPVAVSVLQGEELQQSQVLDVKDLQFLVPSLRVTQLQTSGNTNFLIRGFGNGANNAGIEPSVGVFVDGVYRSRSASALADLPNLERIEVLRGPQSTLFGKNASAGVISVVTAKPSLDDVTGSASLTVGDYSQVVAKGDVSGPLSETVGFSLSGSVNQRDGYYENLAGGDALGELDRWGVRGQLLFVPSDSTEIRFIADMEEIDEACCGVANLLNGPTGAILTSPFIGGDLVPNAPFAYEGYYDFTPRNEFENSGISMQIDYDINDNIALTSITAMRTLDRFDNADVDFTSAALIDSAQGNLTDTEIDTLTQELRLSGSTDAMNWMVGAYYFDEDIKQDTGLIYGPDFRTYADLLTVVLGGGTPGVDPSPLGPLETALTLPAGTFFAAGTGLTEASTMDNQAFSLFAQFDFDLGDKTTMTLGVNYTEDEKDVTFDSTATDVFSSLDMVQIGFAQIFAALEGADPGNPANGPTATALSTVPCSTASPPPACNPLLALQPLQFLPPNIDYPNSVESGTSKDDDVTWTAKLAHDLTDDVNIYVSAGTGFKASSWNLSRDSRPFASDLAALGNAGLLVPNLTTGTRFAEPEESTVYEIGLKGSWDTVALNLAIFDQEIENFQSNTFVGTGFVLLNAGKQSTTGVEIDIRWAPIENLETTFAATLMDPKYDSFVQAACVPPPGSTSANFTCDLSGETPSGIHETSITATGNYKFQVGNAYGFVRAEYIYEDDIQIVDNVPQSIASREVNTINASFGLAWDNGFEAMLWGRNLNNDEYLMSAFPSVAQNGSYSGYPNPPRTYGLTVRKFFE
ncbi:MAG: TonB-dependent receptor [Woeseiaceae bacterium]|nr:TonB-dependent receptor [Woeseiaceae bacterium]